MTSITRDLTNSARGRAIALGLVMVGVVLAVFITTQVGEAGSAPAATLENTADSANVPSENGAASVSNHDDDGHTHGDGTTHSHGDGPTWTAGIAEPDWNPGGGIQISVVRFPSDMLSYDEPGSLVYVHVTGFSLPYEFGWGSVEAGAVEDVHVDGTGYVQVTLDGRPLRSGFTSPVFGFRSIDAGATIEVTLMRGDHQPYLNAAGEPVTDTYIFD